MIQWLILTEQKRYEPIAQTPQPHFGIVHAFYAVMGGFAFYGSYVDDTPKSLFEISTNPRCIVEVPNFNTLVYIVEHFPHIFADITEEYILDQAASSSLSKAVLSVQVAWFCMNWASRLFQSLPLSLLEVSTASHALCALLTYFVWRSKPINVATPTLLREKEAQEVYALLKCSDDEYDKEFDMARKEKAGDSSMRAGPHISEKIVLAAGALQHLPTPKRPPRSLRFYNSNRVLVPGAVGNESSNERVSMFITIAISPILYGTVHFLAWGEQFPTPLERLLWRVSSSVETCSGLVEILLRLSLNWLYERSDLNYHSFSKFMVQICLIITPLAHVLASCFLIVESVRQLSFLDDTAYQLPPWSNYWPHFS